MKLRHTLPAIVLAFCSIVGTYARGWSEPLSFHSFSTPEGLPNSMVHEVYQDRGGFLWIATFYGLYRYDGYELQTYKSNLYTPGLLPDNNVLCLEEDHAHRLWIGTHKGLCVLDKPTGKLRRMQLDGIQKHRLNDLCVTRDNRIYLGYIRGMAYYDEQGDSLVRMTRANCRGDVPEGINIQTILEDEQGDLLIGTWSNGLYRYRPLTNEFVHYASADLPLSVLSLFRDSRGQTWLGSYGKGLYRLAFDDDRRTASVTGHYAHKDKADAPHPSDYIYAIAEDRHTHTLWLGTREGIGLVPLDGDDGTLIRYHEGDPTRYLPVHEVNSVMCDRDGRMWMGTKGAGVIHADTRPQRFHITYPTDRSRTNYVSAVHIDAAGGVWTGLDYGVTFQTDAEAPARTLLAGKRPYHIAESPSTGCVLVAVHDEGILSCRNGRVVGQYKKPTHDFIPNNLVYAVHEDRRGHWWVASYQGLGVRYRDGRSCVFNRLPGADPLLSRELTALTEAPDGTLWLATAHDGALHLTGNLEQPETLVCRAYTPDNGGLPVYTPLCLFVDSRGTLWAGTEGSGLCRYDADADSFCSVHRDYNLPGDMVGSIQEDPQGRLWVGTNQGLVRLTLHSAQTGTRIFTTADGLPDNFFNRNASCTRGGRLYFGCSRGLVAFDPLQPDAEPTHVPLRFTGIVVDGINREQLPPDEQQALTPHTPDFTSTLTLPARYTDLAVQFAALTYHQPERNRYAYRLTGFEDEWHYTDAAGRQAYYANLDPGHYTLEVRAANAQGDWGDTRRLDIHVETPLWATWWAYLLYLAAATALATAIIREERRKIKLRARIDQLLQQCARTTGDYKQQLAIEIKDLHYTDPDEQFLQDAIACANRHLSEADFDIPSFAAELAVSRTTLHKRLTTLTGMNASGFLRNIRLKTACRLLRENPHIRISDLAYQVGFNDPKYFSVCFKREFGIQPSEYVK